MNAQELLKPERGVNESFRAYQSRRKQGHYFLRKVKAFGRVFWNSMNRGTYVLPKR